MKGTYEKAEMEVIRFESEDIITSSNDTPVIIDDGD